MKTVRDVMNPERILLGKKETVRDALQLMTEHKVNGAPVVDSAGKLAGMVVKADIYRFLIDPGHIDSYTLDLVMSKDVVTTSPDEHLADVAKKIIAKDVIALPVIENEFVLGVITIQDLMRAFIVYCEALN